MATTRPAVDDTLPVLSLKAYFMDIIPECPIKFTHIERFTPLQCQPKSLSMASTQLQIAEGRLQQESLGESLAWRNKLLLQDLIHAFRLSTVHQAVRSLELLVPGHGAYFEQDPFQWYREVCVRRIIVQLILRRWSVRYWISVVAFVMEYLIGYVQRGSWATYSDTSWEFRATYCPIELRLAAYFWIKFRAPTQPSSVGHGASSVVPTGTGDLHTRRRKRLDCEPGISTKHYGKREKYEPRVYVSGKRVPLGEYDTPEAAANVFWVAGYYHRYVLADYLPFDATSLPEIPPEHSDEGRYSWIRKKAQEWAASSPRVPGALPPAVFTSPTGISEPASPQDQQFLDVLFPKSPCQATREAHTVASEPQSSCVPPGQCQQGALEGLPCQATQTALTVERVLQDFDKQSDDTINHPFTSAPEHPSTGLVNKPALGSGYFISAPPGETAPHSCTEAMPAFEEIANQGWEVSPNRFCDRFVQKSPCQATREVHKVASEPQSSCVPLGHCQQQGVLEELPYQATQTAPTIERILQDFDKQVDGTTNLPFTSAPQHASTCLVIKPALGSGYLISAPPGETSPHSCALAMSAFEKFAKQGWEVSLNRFLHTYYFIREPTGNHGREDATLVLSPTIISAFTEFQKGGWTVQFVDR